MSRTIYIDSDYICHVQKVPGLHAMETDFFDGKCNTLIEGYRYIPEGHSWTREDGAVFTGIMIAPVKDYNLLAAAQAQYEQDQAELAAAFQEGVNSV